MVYMIGDTHVHVPHTETGTGNAVRGAIARGLDFVVFAYHSYTDRFDRFLYNPQLGPEYEVTPMGSIAKVTHKRGTFYAIKGEQITSDMDIIAWPIKQEIIPGNRDLREILEEAREQGAIRVWSKPSRDKLRKCRINPSSIINYFDAVELSLVPEILVDNDFAAGISRTYSKPLFAGSDARLPYAIMPCTGFHINDIRAYNEIENQDQFMDIINGAMSAEPVYRNIITFNNRHSLSSFALQYAYHALYALKKDPKGVVKSFLRSHL